MNHNHKKPQNKINEKKLKKPIAVDFSNRSEIRDENNSGLLLVASSSSSSINSSETDHHAISTNPTSPTNQLINVDGSLSSNSSSKLNVSEYQSSNSDFEQLELNDELAAENLRLKQTIADLRQQLSNAEVS